MLEIDWQGGVRVMGTPICFDGIRPRETCFVSSADVSLKKRALPAKMRPKILATERTRQLKFPSSDDVLVSPFSRPFALGRARVELLPSGHLPGAAQLLIEVKGDRVLYAGALNPKAGRLSEACKMRDCSALILSAPLAPLTVDRSLPPREEVESALILAVQRAIEKKRTPVVLAPVLGAAQEVVALFSRARISLKIHPRIAQYVRQYRQLGIEVAETAEAKSDERVWIWPVNLKKSLELSRLRATTLLFVSGEAIDPAAVKRAGAREGFPLADHGDLRSLVEYAVAAGAREVYLTSGFGDRVAKAFARRKISAHALEAPSQMSLFR